MFIKEVVFMLEKFQGYDKEQICSLAQIVHQFENGTVKQRNLDEFFHEEEWDYYADDLVILGCWSTNIPQLFSGYTILKDYVREAFPEMEEAYLPFAVSDLLKEAFEANQKGE